MRKVYLAVALVFLSLGLSGCVLATVGKCVVWDSSNRPCQWWTRWYTRTRFRRLRKRCGV